MSELKKRNFHEAQWDESIIYEQSVPGSRGVLVPDVSEEASKVTGDVSTGVEKGKEFVDTFRNGKTPAEGTKDFVGPPKPANLTPPTTPSGPVPFK